MTGPREIGGVREHYRQLAAEYNRKANPACVRAYKALAARHLGGARRILDLGAGAAGLLAQFEGAERVAGDLSVHMLAASDRYAGSLWPVACDAQRLPFPDAAFDAIVSINLLEHVPDPSRVLSECARVLVPGGRCLVVTPNGDVESLLDLLERLHLKLPEGPHRFLGYRELGEMVPSTLSLTEHHRFLSVPVGPQAFVEAVDRRLGDRGLFQYAVMERL